MNAIRAALLAMTFLVPATAVMSQNANPLADREDKIIPAVLLWMQQTGVKLTYLGNEGGIRGYLAESATGNMQTIYVAPDGKSIVIGLLYDENFAKENSNLTGVQLDQMRTRYNAVADSVSKVNLNDPVAVDKALRDLDVPKPAFDLPTFSVVDDKAYILNKLREDGYELTALGQEGGLLGYFSKKNGIAQTLYVTPDGKHVVAGMLMERGGRNVTGVQLGEMRARFESLGQVAPSSDAKLTAEIPATEPSAPSTPEAPSAETGSSSVQIPQNDPVTPIAGPSVSLPDAAGPAPNSQGNPSAIYQATLDEKSFADAVDKASWFDVGSMTAPTLLYMVADPGCPYCHQTWDYIRPFIAANQLRVRVIMISFLEGSDPKAMEIMASPKPGIRFMETDGGARMGVAKVDPNSDHYKSMVGHLLNNRKFTEKFEIEGTPFLAYKDKDGQFYMSKGLPASLEAFFSAANLKK